MTHRPADAAPLCEPAGADVPHGAPGADVRPGTPMRAAIGFILVTVTLDVLSMSMVIPVLPPLIQRFEGGNAAAAAHALGLFVTTAALMQFVFSPVQGALSDCFGRRPIILLANLGSGIDNLLLATAPNLWFLFVARIISGIAAASFACAAAYVTDVTAPERRAARFGLISVAFGFGLVTGPAIGALLSGVDLRLPFYVSAGLCLANFLFGLFVLPESLPRQARTAWHWRRANPVASLRLLRERPGLAGLAWVTLLSLIAQNALPTITVLYVVNRYGYTEHQLALLLGALGLCAAVVGGVLTGQVVRLAGERWSLLAGLTCGVAGYLFMALARTGGTFIWCIPLLALSGLAPPALNALMTLRVRHDEQGRLQGAVSSLLGISGVVAPGLYTESYAWFAAPRAGPAVPGAPFIVAAAVTGLSLVVAWFAVRGPGQAKQAPG